ncbi:putative Serine/threonine-protein kinase PBS1 [Tripterygium wilfordii]|uniref:Putative Serine/threonine-protein kinase PBS1 n=1 Tax=Tripterygium wilfordii TaxID=458696 RepID=A0A7J7D624_TRIWF|nr:putative Serine/threonine-protein kinase PBS1 [Tripterygium wilfordii]
MDAQSPGTPVVRVVHHQDLNKRILVALIVASTLLGCLLLSLVCFWICRFRNLKNSAEKTKQNIDSSAKGVSSSPLKERINSSRITGKKDSVAIIDYQLLEAATENFQENNILGEGGRGRVYRARFDEKSLAAVKRGLEYLHEHCNPPVVHRDLKSSNVLLDFNFNAKLSDFGLAVTVGTQNKNIKLSGTLGYVAPEYLLEGKLTDKSDVYAFGVVLLELLTGRKPVEKMSPSHCQSLVTWAMPQLTDRSKLPNIVDPAIRDTMDLKHLYQVAAVAVLCVQTEPSYRPLITDVLHSLIPLVPLELGGSLRIS